MLAYCIWYQNTIERQNGPLDEHPVVVPSENIPEKTEKPTEKVAVEDAGVAKNCHFLIRVDVARELVPLPPCQR